ncbi:MAG: rhodanese-like domain-containing protein [Pseudobdellovibrionaceae bacterium]
MNQALPIGYFQFDNLIRNRIPFLLLRTNVDVESAFGVMEKMHLRNYSLILNPLDYVEAEAALKERQARKEDPIVVLCDTGEESKKLADELARQGHLNVYFLLDGWKAALEEMSK